MKKTPRSQLFDELARFDGLLTRIDPALGIEAFNKIMTRPAGAIPPPDVKHTDRYVPGRDNISPH